MKQAESSDRNGANRPRTKKLPRLPQNARVRKRPILRPIIPSPYAGADQPKVVYVSNSTPFVSTVKRVRKLLTLIDKRAMGKINLMDAHSSDRQRLGKLLEKTAPSRGKELEEVTLKATNRAIEKVLGLALFFQGQDDCRVQLRTGTVGVVDDIELSDLQGDCDEASHAKGDQEEEFPESRIRKVTVVEVAIALK